MSFAQVFVVAIVITVWAVIATGICAAREMQSRRAQRHNPARIYTPAYGLMDDDSQALEPNAELMHAVRRLG